MQSDRVATTYRFVGILLLLAPFSSSGTSAQESALRRLEESPRHHEWVTIEHDSRKVHAFLAFPERTDPAPAIIVIHENRGLNDWVRSVADQLAEAGYLAIAPDLLSGMGPGGGKTSDFANSDAAREALYELPSDQITADLNAVGDYVSSLPAATGKLVVAGFCWGGSQSFRFATNRGDLAAAYVFYGTAPDDPRAIARVASPVYGFYGGSDARVNSTLAVTEKLMADAHQTFEPVIYEDAGHGFMRRGEDADPSDPNARAHDAAWKRWLLLLGQL